MAIFNNSETSNKHVNIKIQDIEKKLQKFSSNINETKNTVTSVEKLVDDFINSDKSVEGKVSEVIFDSFKNQGSFVSKIIKFYTNPNKEYEFLCNLILTDVSFAEKFNINLRLNGKMFFQKSVTPTLGEVEIFLSGIFLSISTESYITVEVLSTTTSTEFVVKEIEIVAKGEGINNYTKPNTFVMDHDNGENIVAVSNNGKVSYYRYNNENEILKTGTLIDTGFKVEKFYFSHNYNYVVASIINVFENRLIFSKYDEDGLFSIFPSKPTTILTVCSEPVYFFDAAPRKHNTAGIMVVALVNYNGEKAIRLSFLRTSTVAYTAIISPNTVPDIGTTTHCSVIKYLFKIPGPSDQAFVICKKNEVFIQTSYTNLASVNLIKVADGNMAYGFYTSTTTISLYFRNSGYFKKTLTLEDGIWILGPEEELDFCFDRIYVSSEGVLFCEYNNRNFIIKA